MQNSDGEQHCSSKQEAPQTFSKACEHMVDPCKEADNANKVSHYFSLFGGGTNRSSASMLHGFPPVLIRTECRRHRRVANLGTALLAFVQTLGTSHRSLWNQGVSPS